ncbi:MAG: RNA polymerase sigma factor [Pirellulales bacterium]
MHDKESIDLVARYRGGDEQAADELFKRYVGRLTALARSRLSQKMSRRIDADDVVQSAYRSFFVHARQGSYSLDDSGDLWRLLVVITLNKLRSQVERHSAGKRAINAEQSFAQDNSLVRLRPEAVTREPSPDEALAVVEEVAKLMQGLNPLQCKMVELRLQGYQLEEIAEQVNRSERGVRRLLDKIKDRLNDQMAGPSDE